MSNQKYYHVTVRKENEPIENERSYHIYVQDNTPQTKPLGPTTGSGTANLPSLTTRDKTEETLENKFYDEPHEVVGFGD